MAAELIIIGFALIAVGALITLPAIGVGTFFPGLGDLIDLPLSGVMILSGLLFLIAGGLGYFISTYWWAVATALIVWLLFFVLKIHVGGKRRRARA